MRPYAIAPRIARSARRKADETDRPASRVSPDAARALVLTTIVHRKRHRNATTLKGICAELKIAPRVAREKLRAAIREPKKYPNLAKAHKPRQPWRGLRHHPLEKEARLALSA